MKMSLMVLILLFLPIISCKKDKSLDFSSTIIGEWSWIRTCGGFVGCLTPQSGKYKG
jgi:hypothetical protein